jgi:hypothetical protein
VLFDVEVIQNSGNKLCNVGTLGLLEAGVGEKLLA